jgi:hypothetical protein
MRARRGGWRGPLAVAAVLGLAGAAGAEDPARAVVTGLPYEAVWAAALEAVAGYPLERSAAGVIVTARVERAPRPEAPDERGCERVAERVRVAVDPFGERVTRVSVTVEVEGLRAGAWAPLAGGEGRAREILARLRAAQG